MTSWINASFRELRADYLKSSFKYCGITTSIVSEYHSELTKLINSSILPSNTTIDLRDALHVLTKDKISIIQTESSTSAPNS